MAEIENVAVTALHTLKESCGFTANDVWCGGEDEWVKVALDRDVVWQGVVVAGQIYGPVDTQNTGACANEGVTLVGHAFGENDDGEVGRQGVDDAFDPF